MRKGVSFTLVIIISALLMVIAATTIVLSSQGILEQFTDFLEGGTPTDTDEIRSYCMERKLQACQGVEEGSKTWAENVETDGKTCEQWAEQENVFGPDGTESIPPC